MRKLAKVETSKLVSMTRGTATIQALQECGMTEFVIVFGINQWKQKSVGFLVPIDTSNEHGKEQAIALAESIAGAVLDDIKMNGQWGN